MRELRIDLDDLCHLHLVEGPRGVEMSLQERLTGRDVMVPLPSDAIEDVIEFLREHLARLAREGTNGSKAQLDGS